MSKLLTAFRVGTIAACITLVIAYTNTTTWPVAKFPYPTLSNQVSKR